MSELQSNKSSSSLAADEVVVGDEIVPQSDQSVTAVELEVPSSSVDKEPQPTPSQRSEITETKTPSVLEVRTPVEPSDHSRDNLIINHVEDEIVTQAGGDEPVIESTPTPSQFFYRDTSSLPAGGDVDAVDAVNIQTIEEQNPILQQADISSQMMSTTLVSHDEANELREQLQQMQLRCESMERMLQDTSNDNKVKMLTEQLGVRAERIKVLEGQNAKNVKLLKKNQTKVKHLETEVASLREDYKKLEQHCGRNAMESNYRVATNTPTQVSQQQVAVAGHSSAQQQQQTRRVSLAPSIPMDQNKIPSYSTPGTRYGVPPRNSQLVSMVNDLQDQLDRAQEAIIASAGDAFEEAVADSVEQVLDPESPRRSCLVAEPIPPPSRAEQYAMEALQRLSGTSSVPEFSHSRYLFSQTPLSPWRKRHTEQSAFDYFLPCSGVSLGATRSR